MQFDKENSSKIEKIFAILTYIVVIGGVIIIGLGTLPK